MMDIFSKLYEGFTDTTKRFEDRVLQATQLLGQCHSSWFLELSKALHPLLAFNDIETTYQLYSTFIYEQSKYQLPAVQALSIIHEAETRMKDKQIRLAMARIRLGTFLVFRWLDTGTPQYGRNACSFCNVSWPPEKNRFGDRVKGTWALLKYGNQYSIKLALPLEDALHTKTKIELPDGPSVSIVEICEFLTRQMDAINSLLSEMAKDIGVIHARSDFLRGIDLNIVGRPAIPLSQLMQEDESNTPIYRLIADVDRVWKVGLLTERQEQLTLGVNEFEPKDELEK